MKINRIHSWDISSFQQAKEVQLKIAETLIISGEPKDIHIIAGADLAFSKNEQAFAAIVLLEYPSLKLLDTITGVEDVKLPYVPGFLSFREAPLIIDLFEKLQLKPDLVMLDGQGIAHPRGLGIASHVGLFLGIPTIGCAKSRLVGKYEEPAFKRGSYSSLIYKEKKIGYVLRTRNGVKPVFISPGHLIGLDASLKLAMSCVDKYKIPEPTRQAHLAVSRFKKSLVSTELS